MAIAKLMFSSSMWMMLPYPFLKYLNNGELILLAYLISWANMKNMLDDKFFCKAKQITEELFITKATQTNLITSLEKKGFIKVFREGMPQSRKILLNWKKLDKVAEELIPEVAARRDKRIKRRVVILRDEDDVPYNDE